MLSWERRGDTYEFAFGRGFKYVIEPRNKKWVLILYSGSTIKSLEVIKTVTEGKQRVKDRRIGQRD